MGFANRFIEVPIKVYDREHKELTGKEELFDCVMKINPFEISHYKPTFAEDEDDFKHTYVYMKNGDSFYAYLSVEEFENLLNKFN